MCVRQFGRCADLQVGGNSVQNDATGAADFGDIDGLQSIRMFTPCGNGKCDIVEDATKLRMATPRWYATASRLTDGSAMIIGGSLAGGWTNNMCVGDVCACLTCQHDEQPDGRVLSAEADFGLQRRPPCPARPSLPHRPRQPIPDRLHAPRRHRLHRRQH